MAEHIRLPWPDKDLSPNARVHWSRLSKKKAEAKTTAWAICREAGLDKMEGRVHLTIAFCQPDNRRRDMDNLIASMKASIDGISRAIGVDDRHFGYTFAWGKNIPGGAVKVAISQVPELLGDVPFMGVGS